MDDRAEFKGWISKRTRTFTRADMIAAGIASGDNSAKALISSASFDGVRFSVRYLDNGDARYDLRGSTSDTMADVCNMTIANNVRISNRTLAAALKWMSERGRFCIGEMMEIGGISTVAKAALVISKLSEAHQIRFTAHDRCFYELEDKE